MKNKDKLRFELFIGKVVEEIGFKKTCKLMDEVNEAFGQDKKTFQEKVNDLYEERK